MGVKIEVFRVSIYFILRPWTCVFSLHSETVRLSRVFALVSRFHYASRGTVFYSMLKTDVCNLFWTDDAVSLLSRDHVLDLKSSRVL